MSESAEQYGIPSKLSEGMRMTAVEWLVQEINKMNVSTEAIIFINKLEKKAKEMEQEQICTAYLAGDCQNLSASEYFKQTFQREK